MQAIVQEAYGSTDVLELRDIETPAIADDEVLVEVAAAGVDRGVWHLMTGLPYALRLSGYGIRAPKHQVPGMDLAGKVVAVGKDVTRFQVGDEVFGIGKGSFATYAAAPESKLAPKPANLSPVEAAGLAISGLAALQAVRDQAEVQPGHKVLVLGASGGVGGFVVQIAKAYGAEVTGVSSGAKADMVQKLGADHVIDYRSEDFAAGGPRFDAIIDTGGNSSLSHLRKALKPHGTLVIVGGEGGGRFLGGTDRQVRAMVLSRFVGQRLRTFISSENHEDLLGLKDLAEAGQVTPYVDRTFALSEAPDAIDYLLAGNVRGKTVVAV